MIFKICLFSIAASSNFTERTLFPVCTKSLCVNVTIIDDDVLETEESLAVSGELSEEAVRNGILLNNSRLEIDILDNDDGEYIQYNIHLVISIKLSVTGKFIAFTHWTQVLSLLGLVFCVVVK